MEVNEFLAAISKELPWGKHLFGIDIAGLSNTAFQIVDFDIDQEIVRLKAVGDHHIREHTISDLFEIERDVCSCGDTQCEWHEPHDD